MFKKELKDTLTEFFGEPGISNIIIDYKSQVEIPYFFGKKYNPNVSKQKQCWGKISYKNIPNHFIEENFSFLNWKRLTKNLDDEDRLTKDFIDQYDDEIHWTYLIKKNGLNENFLNEFQENIKWSYIMRTFTLKEDFINKYKHNFNASEWSSVCKFQTLTEDFMIKNRKHINWKTISYYQDISLDFVLKFEKKINWNNYFCWSRRTFTEEEILYLINNVSHSYYDYNFWYHLKLFCLSKNEPHYNRETELNYSQQTNDLIRTRFREISRFY